MIPIRRNNEAESIVKKLSELYERALKEGLDAKV